MYFVAATIYQKAKRLALAEGLEPKLLEAIDAAADWKEDQSYLSFQHLLSVYEAADRLLDPGFPVRQGMQLFSEDYGTLGLAWRTCIKAKDIFQRLQRFMVLVTDYGSAHLQEADAKLHIAIERPAGRRGEEMANETSFVMLINILKEVTAKDIKPIRVEFQHDESHLATFEEFFQAPVIFGAKENRLIFALKDLDHSTLKADQHLQSYLVDRMQEEASKIGDQDPLLKAMHQLVKESLPSGIPSLTELAEQVKLSPRTLKRRLADKGHSFRELVQEIQSQSAIYYLEHSSKSLSEITFLTGFSEQSAFNRAFKRWTGKAPSQYRKENR